MAIIKIDAELETEAFIDNPTLEMVLRVALEKVFFTGCKVNKLLVSRHENTADTQESTAGKR